MNSLVLPCHYRFNTELFVVFTTASSKVMDNRQTLINVLKELHNNIDIVFQLSQISNEKSLDELFFEWHRHRLPITTPEGCPTGAVCHELQEIGNVLQMFAEVVVCQIAQGQTVDGCHTRLTELRIEREQIERKLQRLTINQEKEEALLKFDLQSRFQLIQDLKSRLLHAEDRTTICLRLAKECGDSARKEWGINNQKPLEEQRLQYELLNAQLSDVLKENACTEQQLTKCCEERKREIEATTSTMTSDINQRQKEVDELRQEVLEQSTQLENLESTLSVITIEYDEIMEQRRLAAEELATRRQHQRRIEASAIKIQRWFRMILLRTIKSRKKRKKAKRKISKEVKRDPVEEMKKPPQMQTTQSGSEYFDGPEDRNDLQTLVAISVLQKLASTKVEVAPEIDNVEEEIEPFEKGDDTRPSMEITSNDGVDPKAGQITETEVADKNRKTTSSIRSITVKKSKTDASAVQQDTAENTPNTKLNRSSQTDNRVPKSKKKF